MHPVSPYAKPHAKNRSAAVKVQRRYQTMASDKACDATSQPCDKGKVVSQVCEGRDAASCQITRAAQNRIWLVCEEIGPGGGGDLGFQDPGRFNPGRSASPASRPCFGVTAVILPTLRLASCDRGGMHEIR